MSMFLHLYSVGFFQIKYLIKQLFSKSLSLARIFFKKISKINVLLYGRISNELKNGKSCKMLSAEGGKPGQVLGGSEPIHRAQKILSLSHTDTLTQIFFSSIQISKSQNREVHAPHHPHHMVTQLIGCGIRTESRSSDTLHMRHSGELLPRHAQLMGKLLLTTPLFSNISCATQFPSFQQKDLMTP